MILVVEPERRERADRGDFGAVAVDHVDEVQDQKHRAAQRDGSAPRGHELRRQQGDRVAAEDQAGERDALERERTRRHAVVHDRSADARGAHRECGGGHRERGEGDDPQADIAAARHTLREPVLDETSLFIAAARARRGHHGPEADDDLEEPERAPLDPSGHRAETVGQRQQVREL